MNDTTTAMRHTARLMSGIPRTASGFDMPLAAWYQLAPPLPCRGVVTDYVVVTNHAVYPCDSLGQLADFVHCLYERGAVDTTADALARLDGGYVIA
jgi:hypothetical protein